MHISILIVKCCYRTRFRSCIWLWYVGKTI